MYIAHYKNVKPAISPSPVRVFADLRVLNRHPRSMNTGHHDFRAPDSSGIVSFIACKM